MQKNNLIVKEPEELILMRGDFSEGALKLGAYLIANLEKDKVIYKISIKEYLEKFDKKIGDYNYLYNVAQELSEKQFRMEDRFNKRFAIYNFIASADYIEGNLEIEFSQKLLGYLLEVKDKYLKYNIKNIMSLSSKYVIRLYKLLKDNLEKNNRYGNKAELKLSIDRLRETLEIPRSYPYGGTSGIKQRILEKSKKELKEHTDIIFDYEEIKTGRKVTHLKLVIKPNPAKLQELEIREDYNLKSLKYFVTFLRKNYSGNLKFFAFTKKPEDKYVIWLSIDDKGLVYGNKNGEEIKFNAIESERIYYNWWQVAKENFEYYELLENRLDFKEIMENNIDFRLNLNETIDYLRAEGILKV